MQIVLDMIYLIFRKLSQIRKTHREKYNTVIRKWLGGIIVNDTNYGWVLSITCDSKTVQLRILTNYSKIYAINNYLITN